MPHSSDAVWRSSATSVKQFVVAHFRQQHARRRLPADLGRQRRLSSISSSIRSSIVPRQTNLCTSTLLRLADAEGAVGGLVLDGRIPPAVEVDHVRGGGQVEPGAAGLEREDEEGRALVLLEAADQLLPLAHRRAAVQHQAGAPEDLAEERRPAARSSRGTG